MNIINEKLELELDESDDNVDGDDESDEFDEQNLDCILTFLKFLLV